MVHRNRRRYLGADIIARIPTDLIYEAGQAWAENYGLGPCGVVACYVAQKFKFRIVIGEHEDFGPGPSHSWNITDEGTQIDFSLYPDGKIPNKDLWKYGALYDTYDFCEDALSDLFALGPDTNPEEEWKEYKKYLKKYVEMVGWWKLLPEYDRYNILLKSIKTGKDGAVTYSMAKWKDITEHIKVQLMLHYTNYISSPGGCPRCDS